jgi:hypothetical protein
MGHRFRHWALGPEQHSLLPRAEQPQACLRHVPNLRTPWSCCPAAEMDLMPGRRVTPHDGGAYWRSQEAESFDRVLLDAPCSSDRHIVQQAQARAGAGAAAERRTGGSSGSGSRGGGGGGRGEILKADWSARRCRAIAGEQAKLFAAAVKVGEPWETRWGTGTSAWLARAVCDQRQKVLGPCLCGRCAVLCCAVLCCMLAAGRRLACSLSAGCSCAHEPGALTKCLPKFSRIFQNKYPGACRRTG